MAAKLKALVLKYRNILIYIIFGLVTTVVNYLVYLPLYNFLEISAAISNMLAWFVAVIVAFFTNKPFVFQSNDWSLKTVIPEMFRFFAMRVASGLTETVIIFVTVDICHWNGNIWKIITSILVIVLNYIASRFFVFHKNEKAPG